MATKSTSIRGIVKQTTPLFVGFFAVMYVFSTAALASFGMSQGDGPDVWTEAALAVGLLSPLLIFISIACVLVAYLVESKYGSVSDLAGTVS